MQGELALTVVNTSEEPIEISSKIGVSVDNSEYGHGYILNPTSGEYLSYGARWSSAPVFKLDPNIPTIVKGKVSEDLPSTLVYIRFRYKELGSDSVYNVDLDEFLNYNTDNGDEVTIFPSPSPTTHFIPSSVVDESSDEIIEASTNDRSVSKELIKNILISEFLPAPGKEQKEWVEIINNNEVSVYLQDWYIDDIVPGGGGPIKFSIELPKRGYGFLELNKSLLNNSGDTVTLLDNNKNTIHSVKYGKAKINHSIQKVGGKWYITQESTKGTKNIELTLPTKDIIDPIKDISSDTVLMDIATKKTVTKTYEISSDNNEEDLGSVLSSFTDNTLMQPPEYNSYPKVYQDKPYTIEDISKDLHIYTERDNVRLWGNFKQVLSKITW